MQRNTGALLHQAVNAENCRNSLDIFMTLLKEEFLCAFDYVCVASSYFIDDNKAFILREV